MSEHAKVKAVMTWTEEQIDNPVQLLPQLLNFKSKPVIQSLRLVKTGSSDSRSWLGHGADRWFAPWHFANKLRDVVHAITNRPRP